MSNDPYTSHTDPLHPGVRQPMYDLGHDTPPRADLPHIFDILADIREERREQDLKWGEQNHPWNLGYPWATLKTAARTKTKVDDLARKHRLDFAGILAEEFYEAIEETDINRARAELIQVAAVAVAAIESIDRNQR